MPLEENGAFPSTTEHPGSGNHYRDPRSPVVSWRVPRYFDGWSLLPSW